MKKLKWLIIRIFAMQMPGEILYRFQQFLRIWILDLLFINKIEDIHIKKESEIYSDEGLKVYFDKEVDIHTYKCLQITLNNITEIDKFRYDYKNNLSSEIKFHGFINKQNFDKVGDIKYVNEISRFHYFPVICAYACFKKDNSLSAKAEKMILTWIDQNPYLHSVNWKSGIEVGIRLINWVYGYQFLKKANLYESKFEQIFNQAIYHHIKYLRNHLSLYSSSNNHLTAELSGIIIGCSFFTFRNSERWLNEAIKLLFSHILNIFHPDGFSREQSTHYHYFKLQLIILCFSRLQKLKKEIPATVYQRIENSIEILSYLNYSGNFLEIGDSDDGFVFYPYIDTRFNPYYSLLNSSKYILRNKYLYSNRLDLPTYFIVGDRASEIKTAGTKESQIQTKLFDKSGYLILRENSSFLIFDCGNLGYPPLYAHGHADALSFILYQDNLPFLIDTGTFQYHKNQSEWREYFRSTKAHNCISIENSSQAKSSGRMIWQFPYKTSYPVFEENEIKISCKGTIEFPTKKSTIIHERTVEYDRLRKEFAIKDKLTGDNKFGCQFYLHFHPKVNIYHSGPSLKLTHDHIKVELYNTHFEQARIFKGNSENRLGWYSPSYDCILPCYSLELNMNVNRTIYLETLIKTII